MMKVPLVIGIAGNARAGKNTCGDLLQELILENYGQKSEILSFAYEMKKDLDPFIKSKFGFSAFTTIDSEKSLIRPIMVAYGSEAMRNISKGTHWIEKVRPQVIANIAKGVVSIITDLRFQEYEYDEFDFIKEYGGKIVYVERIFFDRNLSILEDNIIQPANELEKVNNLKIKYDADLVIRWTTGPKLSLKQTVNSYMGQLAVG